MAQHINRYTLHQLVLGAKQTFHVWRIANEAFPKKRTLSQDCSDGICHRLIDRLPHGFKMHENGVVLLTVQLDCRLDDSSIRMRSSNLKQIKHSVFHHTCITVKDQSVVKVAASTIVGVLTWVEQELSLLSRHLAIQCLVYVSVSILFTCRKQDQILILSTFP